jgi:membrane protein YdbS with pleckstrin-like domain
LLLATAKASQVPSSATSGIAAAMSLPAPAIAVCEKLQAVLRPVWIIFLVIIIVVFSYFCYLIFLPNEPRLRITKWTGKAHTNLYVKETVEAPEA